MSVELEGCSTRQKERRYGKEECNSSIAKEADPAYVAVNIR